MDPKSKIILPLLPNRHGYHVFFEVALKTQKTRYLCTNDPKIDQLFAFSSQTAEEDQARELEPQGIASHNQRNQESHGGLPHRQTPFVPHVLRYAPSKALEKP